MKRTFWSLLLLFLPLIGRGDGMVFPTLAYPAHVTIPDQRALICFSNGIERLVIETRFTGSGTNFAWVVPVPNPPTIEKATSGLFPTLGYLFQPKVIHDVPHFYIGILSFIGIVYFLVRKRPSVAAVLLVSLLVLLVAALLLPALGTAGSSAISAGPDRGETVSIIDRKIIGMFDTTTVASKDAKALQDWLSKNGYALPEEATPIIDRYVKSGWVFVATTVRRDAPSIDTSTLHPLSFTFKTDKPVYPMQLTALGNHSVTVELYVVSNDRSSSGNLKVESCTKTKFAYPLLQAWTGDLPVTTKLVGTVSPEQMRQDLWIESSPFSEQRYFLYSRHGALTSALDFGAAFFALGLIACLLLAVMLPAARAHLRRSVLWIAMMGILLAALIYVFLPTTDVRLVRGGRMMAIYTMRTEQSSLSWA
ncbi:MAG TPA: DUF2330 domain-containing protein, partial [Desulfuromonadaceae bacterium]|nr:DUF2330 domain-containing protein [Desulfuromonadaceae bacterium]